MSASVEDLVNEVPNPPQDLMIDTARRNLSTNRLAFSARNTLGRLLLAIFTSAMSIFPSSAQTTFRVVHYMNQLGPPIGLTEGTPGVFYSDGGYAYQGAFSITTQGTTTNLGRFPNGYNLDGPLVSGANGRFTHPLSSESAQQLSFL